MQLMRWRYVEKRPIIWVDESWFAHDVYRPFGYSRIGKLCYGKKDWEAKGRTNVIGALLGKRLLCSYLINCNVDSDVFHAWITQQLLPVVPKNAVIIMDNASFHKRKDTQQAIADAGFILEFLPPYSPQLNPIEKFWAKAKAIRRKFKCSVEELFGTLLHN